MIELHRQYGCMTQFIIVALFLGAFLVACFLLHAAHEGPVRAFEAAYQESAVPQIG